MLFILEQKRGKELAYIHHLRLEGQETGKASPVSLCDWKAADPVIWDSVRALGNVFIAEQKLEKVGHERARTLGVKF